MRRLKDALHEVAIRAEAQKKYARNKELADANQAALTLFGSPDPIYRRRRPNGPPENITLLALVRVHRYLRRNGINWRLIDWDTLVEWLWQNWDKILRVILTLLPLILI